MDMCQGRFGSHGIPPFPAMMGMWLVSKKYTEHASWSLNGRDWCYETTNHNINI